MGQLPDSGWGLEEGLLEKEVIRGVERRGGGSTQPSPGSIPDSMPRGGGGHPWPCEQKPARDMPGSKRRDSVPLTPSSVRSSVRYSGPARA